VRTTQVVHVLDTSRLPPCWCIVFCVVEFYNCEELSQTCEQRSSFSVRITDRPEGLISVNIFFIWNFARIPLPELT
jgi:hypothetical protein